MPTNPPANPLPGAIYVDQTTNLSWVWTGTFWLQATGGSQNYNSQSTATTALIPGHYSEPSPDSWFPHIGATAPSYPTCGQIWVDNSVTPNYASVWDCNTNTWIQLGGVPGGDTNSIVQPGPTGPLVRVSGDSLQTGDIWIDSSNSSVYYYNGGWNLVSIPDSHTIYNTTQPLTRVGGSPLQPGDLWVQPGSGILKYTDGAGNWSAVVAMDADHQLSVGPPLTRADGTLPFIQGDQYTDTSSATLFYYDNGWVRYNDTHSIEATAKPLTRTDLSALRGGDQWYNPTTNDLWVYDSTISDFALVTTNDTHSFFTDIALAARPVTGDLLQDGDMLVSQSQDIFGYHSLRVRNTSTNLWEKVGEKDTHSMLGVVDPTPALTRPNTVATIDGDLFINTLTGESWYYKASTASWTKFGTDTHSWLGSGDPNVDPVFGTARTRPDGTPLKDGDIVIDQSTEQGWYYDSAANGGLGGWTLFGSDTHSFTGNGTPFLSTGANPGTAPQDTRPNGSSLKVGDQFLDVGTRVLYCFTGADWEVVSNDTHSIIGTADPNIPPVSIRPDGSPIQSGDIFIDTNSKQGYYYDPAAFAGLGGWELFGADTHTFTGFGTPYKTTSGSPGSAPQDTRPNGSSLVDGDQYIDLNTRTLYNHILGVWYPVNDTQSILQTNQPLTRPNGEGFQDGDQWVDTNYSPAIESTYNAATSTWVPHGDVTTTSNLAAITGKYDNQMIVDTTNNRMYRWDPTAGPAWVQVV